MPLTIFIYTFIFLYGIVIGSFLNVCILRIPEGMSISKERSHCMSCGHVLRWYDLFPLFSYLFLRGRCRYCGSRISAQYPVVEAANGVLWILCFVIGGFGEKNGYAGFLSLLLQCLTCSALLVIAVIDARTHEIPLGLNIFILVIGVLNLILDIDNLTEYVIGFFSVSMFFLVIYLITRGRGIGGGDIKLMAAAGLFLGWKCALLALIVGCFLASVIHLTLMRVKGAGRELAMGPYLAGGIVTAMWFGSHIIEWYTSLF